MNIKGPLKFTFILTIHINKKLRAHLFLCNRPSQNNQRYAFTQLLDGDDGYSSDEDILYNDSWEGLKLRSKGEFPLNWDDRYSSPFGQGHPLQNYAFESPKLRCKGE